MKISIVCYQSMIMLVYILHALSSTARGHTQIYARGTGWLDELGDKVEWVQGRGCGWYAEKGKGNR